MTEPRDLLARALCCACPGTPPTGWALDDIALACHLTEPAAVELFACPGGHGGGTPTELRMASRLLDQDIPIYGEAVPCV